MMSRFVLCNYKNTTQSNAFALATVSSQTHDPAINKSLLTLRTDGHARNKSYNNQSDSNVSALSAKCPAVIKE
jgi:hypothetical protein